EGGGGRGGEVQGVRREVTGRVDIDEKRGGRGAAARIHRHLRADDAHVADPLSAGDRYVRLYDAEPARVVDEVDEERPLSFVVALLGRVQHLEELDAVDVAAAGDLVPSPGVVAAEEEPAHPLHRSAQLGDVSFTGSLHDVLHANLDRGLGARDAVGRDR